MDERFNDGTKLPYGWFTEGWTVKDGVIRTEASSGFNFDLTELDTIYKTFTISDTPEGQYRFRFRAGGAVLIDSVAGFHIDNEAPDIYIIESDGTSRYFDLQGRMLSGKPNRGLYINNGKIVFGK